MPKEVCFQFTKARWWSLDKLCKLCYLPRSLVYNYCLEMA